MLVKLLNKLGLYTARQYREFKFYNEALEVRLRHLVNALKASEEAKAEANNRAIKLAKELNELKLKYARRVKGKKSYVK